MEDNERKRKIDNKKETDIEIDNMDSNSLAVAQKKIIKVNPKMKGTPIIPMLPYGSWIYDKDTVGDFQINDSTICIFLSMKFHSFNPKYIHDCFKIVHNKFKICMFLVLCDIYECSHIAKELNMIAMYEKASLILAWSLPEAVHYIVTLKKEENSAPSVLRKNDNVPHLDSVIDILTTIKGVSFNDANNLCSKFKTFKNIINATIEELSTCHGIGPNKAERLYQIFRKKL